MRWSRVILIAFMTCWVRATPPERPNVILILCDDLGINDVGAYTSPSQTSPYPASGPSPINNSSYNPLPAPNWAWDSVNNVSRTPNIDQLGTDGITLTSFYAASPVCSPSRAAVMTGSYPKRVDINFVYFPDADNGLNPDEITIAELLKLRGYATGMVGKWHLGDRKDFLPTRHGFDRYFGLLYSNDMWVGNYRTQGWEDMILMDQEAPSTSYTTATGGTITNPVDTFPEQAYLLEALTEVSLDFIDQQHATGTPFFLYYAPHVPHTPCIPHPDFDGETGLGTYADVVVELDHRIGQLMQKLTDLNIANDTLVMFTSDNGPWVTRYGNQQDQNGTLKRLLPENTSGSAYPFRGYKHETWEGGQRVPFLAKFPGVIPSGSTTDEVAAHFDLYTTIAAWAGAPQPEDGRVVDGLDLRTMLTQPATALSPHDFFVYYDSKVDNPHGIRDDGWKLRLNKLYDLSTDIQESNNVSNSGVKSTLTSKMNAFDSSLESNDRNRANSRSVSIELEHQTITVPENGTATLRIRLSSSANTTVTLSRKQGDLDSNPDSSTLTFTNANWDQWQTITFSGSPDADSDNGGTLFRATAPSMNLREIFVLEQDINQPAVLRTESNGDTAVTEGGTGDSYELVLSVAPTDPVWVEIQPVSEVTANGTARSSLIEFTSANWMSPQTVPVEAVDDFILEGNHSGSIVHTVQSADSRYQGFHLTDLIVNVSDDEVGPNSPDQPDLADHVVLWLRDPANTFDSGTWEDNSGLGHHVSETASGISSQVSLSPSAGLFNGQKLSAIRIADDGLMASPDLLDDASGFANLTLIVLYQSNTTGSETRPVGIGSKNVSGSANHFNLATDASLRFNDGSNSGTGANHTSDLLLRASRLDSGMVTDWIHTGSGWTLNIAPVASGSGDGLATTSSEVLYLGELAGPTNATTHIVQVVVYRTSLSDAQIQAIGNWMMTHPSGIDPTDISPASFWRERYFTDPDNTQTADQQDYDDDGEINLVERATGSNPTTSSPAPKPEAVVVEIEGISYPGIRYTRLRQGTASSAREYQSQGIQYDTSWTTSLNPLSWTELPAGWSLLGVPVPSPDGLSETVTLYRTEELTTETPSFQRLRIDQAP